MPNLQLTYFDSPGRAEPIRIALHLANLPYEDRRLKFPEFAQLKASGGLPLGAVPVLTIDGVAIVQTVPILRYVARLGAPDLLPEDPYQGLIVDSVLDTFNDTLSHALMPSLFERDMEKKLAMRATLAAGPLIGILAYAEGLLDPARGPFYGGARLSIADLVVAHQLLGVRAGHLDGLTEAVLEPCPRLRGLLDAYTSEPRIVAYTKR